MAPWSAELLVRPTSSRKLFSMPSSATKSSKDSIAFSGAGWSTPKSEWMREFAKCPGERWKETESQMQHTLFVSVLNSDYSQFDEENTIIYDLFSKITLETKKLS